MVSPGAINKKTGQYVYTKIANKIDEYSCPECNKDVILCQGTVRVHYFRHKVDEINPCNYFCSPTETQLHKDAKQLMKTILDMKIQVSFVRTCCCCKNEDEFEIPSTSDSSLIQLEYRFEYGGSKVADVAYIEDGELLCIFEICNTHKTRGENRPDPWFEIDAITLIQIANDNESGALKIPCIRCEKCEVCVKKESEPHNEAKNKLASWLKENKSIELLWECCKPQDTGNRCSGHEELSHKIVYGANDEVVIDYSNMSIKYIADVAVITNNKLKYAFDIKRNNSTITNTNNRPETWFEIPIQDFFDEEINNGEYIFLTCIRNSKTRYCNHCRILDEDWVNNLPRLYKGNGWKQHYKQESPCIKCGETAYRPIFIKGYRQLCEICLPTYEDELKKEYSMKGKCLISI
jgi:hypothetical protein